MNRIKKKRLITMNLSMTIIRTISSSYLSYVACTLAQNENSSQMMFCLF
jgi:hypothetical protein